MPRRSDETSAQAHCRALVATHDHDRYLTALYAGDAARGGLFALYALNVELARIREATSEPMLGEIRLAWWREAMDGLYAGTARPHPVVEALAPHIAAGHLPQAPFMAMIEARINDLYDETPADIEGLERHLEATAGNLALLALALCGVEEGRQALARAAGLAWGVTGIVRAVAFHARAHRLYLPTQELTCAGLTAARVFAGESGPALRPVLRKLAARAAAHADEAARLATTAPRKALPALLPVVLARDYLTRLAAMDYEARAIAMTKGAALRQAKLFWAALKGKI
ncbi:MAG: phytoene/squalene synthase family protein [Pseudomonadota bacterium]